MKVVLVPQVIVNAAFPASSVPYAPLGLLSLAGAVDRARHPTSVVDLTQAVRDRVIAYDAGFEASAARLLLAAAPDLVGFSTFSSTYHHTLRIAEAIRALSPSTAIVFGGPQASFTDRETMEAFPVDAVVRGEGEVTFPALLEALASGRTPAGVAGVTWRDGVRLVREPDRPLIEPLDDLPTPAWDLYPLQRHPKAPLEATRGCPYRCVYCATSRYWQRRVRRKGIDRILDEMEHLKRAFDVEYISFADDTFTMDRAWALDLCRRIVARGIGVRWLCSTRIDAVDDELLAAMARAGCANVFYGIESGSERIQRSIRKGIRIGAVLPNLRATAAHGMAATPSLMMGFPDETEEDLRATLRLRCEIQRLFPKKVNIQVHVLSPDVHTEIALQHADRLRYDGFHADHVGGELARFDRDLILAHPSLFLAYHHVETAHLEREFLKRLHAFLVASQVVAYWTTLYAALVDGDPLALPRAWMEAFDRDPTPPGVPADAPLLRRAVSHAAVWFAARFTREAGYPEPVCELFQHEYDLMRARGSLSLDRETLGRAAGGRPLGSRVHAWDPRETIALLRTDPARIATQPKRPTRIDYVPRSG